jgi:hypothetical protein
VFRHLLERGLIGAQHGTRARHRLRPGPAGQPAARECAQMRSNGAGPAVMAAPAGGPRYTGIELMPRDVARARRRARRSATGPPRFVCGDMRTAAFPAATWS